MHDLSPLTRFLKPARICMDYDLLNLSASLEIRVDTGSALKAKPGHYSASMLPAICGRSLANASFAHADSAFLGFR